MTYRRHLLTFRKSCAASTQFPTGQKGLLPTESSVRSRLRQTTRNTRFERKKAILYRNRRNRLQVEFLGLSSLRAERLLIGSSLCHSAGNTLYAPGSCTHLLI